tara:strand:+ start:3207 stop:5321 length:2115 start_codon:yes stop_codon:yes gene_type:complete
MANREEVIKLAFEADLSDLRKELGKLPEIGTKEAKSMVKALEKQYKRAERAAKKSAKAQKDASGKVKAGFESAKQAAEGFGGAVGGSAGQVEKFARSMFEASKAIGPVGVGLIAAGLATAGFGIAAYKTGELIIGLIGDAEDLADSLEPFSDAGVFAPVPADTQASIERFNDSMSGLSALASSLKLEVGGELANAFGQSAEAMLVGSIAAKELFDALGGVATAFKLASGAAGLIVNSRIGEVTHADALEFLGFGDALDRWRTKANAAIDTARKLTEEQEKQKAATEKATLAAAADAEAKKAQAAAERAQAKAIRDTLKAIEEVEMARESLAKITESTTADLLSAEDKIEAAYDERITSIAEVAMESQDAGAVKEALDAAEARRIRELGALDAERSAAYRSDIADLAALDDARIEQQKRSLNDLAALEEQLGEEKKRAREAAAQDAVSATADGVASIASDIETLARLRQDAIVDNFEDYEESIEKEGKKRRRVQEEEIAGLLESGKISESEAQRRLNNIDAEEKADEKKIKAFRELSAKWSLKAFRSQKAAQKSLAIIDAARSAVSLTAAMAYLGPFAPLMAAGIAGSGLNTQLAVINAQSPPDFPVGGPVGDRIGSVSADHVPILATPSEGVVTARGMDALGREGLASINEGSGGAGQSIILQVGPDVVARAVMSSPDLASRISAELQAVMSITSGRVPVYGRG